MESAGVPEGLQRGGSRRIRPVGRCAGDTLVVGRVGGQRRHGCERRPEGQQRTTPGAAYVFVRSGATWSQQAYLKASNAGGLDGNLSDVFGGRSRCRATRWWSGPAEASDATGVNGDQSDNGAPPGRPMCSCAPGRPGASRPTSRPPMLPASTFSATPLPSLATGGHWATGEHRYSMGGGMGAGRHGAENAGAAYVFVRHGTTWSQETYLKASNPDSEDSSDPRWRSRQISCWSGRSTSRAAGEGVNGNQHDNSLPGAGAAYLSGRDRTPIRTACQTTGRLSFAWIPHRRSVTTAGRAIRMGMG